MPLIISWNKLFFTVVISPIKEGKATSASHKLPSRQLRLTGSDKPLSLDNSFIAALMRVWYQKNLPLNTRIRNSRHFKFEMRNLEI